jgi:hypothetical protein
VSRAGPKGGSCVNSGGRRDQQSDRHSPSQAAGETYRVAGQRTAARPDPQLGWDGPRQAQRTFLCVVYSRREAPRCPSEPSWDKDMPREPSWESCRSTSQRPAPRSSSATSTRIPRSRPWWATSPISCATTASSWCWTRGPRADARTGIIGCGGPSAAPAMSWSSLRKPCASATARCPTTCAGCDPS